MLLIPLYFTEKTLELRSLGEIVEIGDCRKTYLHLLGAVDNVGRDRIRQVIEQRYKIILEKRALGVRGQIVINLGEARRTQGPSSISVPTMRKSCMAHTLRQLSKEPERTSFIVWRILL